MFCCTYCTGAGRHIPSRTRPGISVGGLCTKVFGDQPFVILTLAKVLVDNRLRFTSLGRCLCGGCFYGADLSIVNAVTRCLPVTIVVPFIPGLIGGFNGGRLDKFKTFFSTLTTVTYCVVGPEPSRTNVFVFLLFVVNFKCSFISVAG